MYIFTPPGGLKVATLVFGFILVNIGCDAVFNSDNYRTYIRQQGSSKSEDFVGSVKDQAKTLQCNQLKTALDAINDKDSDEYKKVELRYENLGCTVPAWVVEEMIFVFASISCIVMSVLFLIIPMFCENCKSLHIVDGVFQVILGVLILIGSGCLMGAAFLKYNEGKSRIKEYILMTDAQKDQELDELDRYQVRFYQKITAAALGFINSIIYCVLGIVLCFCNKSNK